MNVEAKYLSNGLKIIFSRKKSVPIVSVRCYIRVGSCWEKKNQEGFSHFTEHLVFKSSKNYPNSSHTEFISNLGGSLNAYTEFDSTCFYISLPSKEIFNGIKVLSDLVMYPNFNENDFNLEKGVVISEKKQYQDDPEDFFIEEIPKFYLPRSPLRKTILGSFESIKNSTLKQLYDFHKSYYVPENAFIVITGDFDDDVFDMLEDTFGKWVKGNRLEHKKSKINYPKKFNYFPLKSKFKSGMIAFVLPEISERSPDSFPLILAEDVFFNDKSSRLYKKLVIEDKLVSSIEANSIYGINDGLIAIVVTPIKGVNHNLIIESFFEVKNEFVKHGITYDEFSKVKRDFIFNYNYSSGFNEQLATNIAQEELFRDYSHYLEQLVKLEKLNLDIINNTVKKYWDNGKINIFSLGNVKVDEERLYKFVENEHIKKQNRKNNKIYYEFKLSNGLKIIYKRVPKQQLVGISLINPVGSFNENEFERGLNNMMYNLFVYGNKKRKYHEILDYLSKYGIDLNFKAGTERSKVNITCFKDMFAESISLMAECIQNPLFPNEFVKSLKSKYKLDWENIKDYPPGYTHHKWKQQVFGKLSQFVSKEGYRSQIDVVSGKKIKKWYESCFNYSLMNMGIVGDLEPSLVEFLCEKYFGKISGSKNIYSKKIIINPGKIYEKKYNLKADQSSIFIGGFAPNFKNVKKRNTMSLIMQILGGDLNSRLFLNLREKMGVAYSVGEDCGFYSDFGFFCLNALVEKNMMEQSIDVIKKELKNIVEQGVTSRELDVIKNYVNGSRFFEEESVITQAEILAITFNYGYDLNYYLCREERLNEVNNELIKSVAEEYFKEKKLFLTISV